MSEDVNKTPPLHNMGPQSVRRWHPTVFLAPLLVGVMLAVTFAYWKKELAESALNRQHTFNHAADQITNGIEERLATYELVLRGTKGYFEGSDSIDRAEFHAYVNALQLQATRPGLQGLALVMRVPHAEKARHIADIRGRGFPDYQITPDGERDFYAPITHIEPLSGPNAAALGFDTATVKLASEAMDLARDSGALALTGKLRLRQDNSPEAPAAIVMYMPLYGKNAQLDSVAGRRAALVGWVDAPLRINDLIAGLTVPLGTEINLEIFDAAGSKAMSPEARLYGVSSTPAPEPGLGATPLQTTRQIDIGGHQWTLAMRTQPTFEAHTMDSGRDVIALMGIALSLLLGWMTWQLATGRRRAEALAHAMTQDLQLSAQVFESSRDGIIITDADNRIVSVNSAWCQITGYSAVEALGRTSDLVDSDRQDESVDTAMRQSIRVQGHWQGEVWNRRKNGENYPQWLSISTVYNARGQVVHYIGILSDLTAHKAAQDRLDYLAHYDALTQLPNRVLLQDRAKLVLTAAQRTGTRATLMFMDLDRFKNINDSLGHPVGDRVLQTLAARFTSHLHADDTVCHQGGDEFIVLLPNADAQGAAHVAKKLLDMVAQPVALETQQLSLTASIGIAIYPDDGPDLEKLSQCAEVALYRAKQNGRNNFQFFTEQMHGQAHEVLLVENHLRRALLEDELVLYYQPQVDAVTSRLIGAEALIRWQHPEWGLVLPARFIPIAEDSGQIREIGDWVLRTATQQAADWQAAGLPIVPVAVNLSALEFRQPSLCDSVSAALRNSGLAPHLLELELTERIAMEDSAFAIDQINQLHALGIMLSIDDFGTGYSSLSYLKRFKIDKLKIDQSFVRDLERDPDDEAIVLAIIGMARRLGFKTIAEGVETQGQLDFLRASQCDEVQGYFFSKPVPAAEFAEMLRLEATHAIIPGI